jgi:hypothetical protein
VCYVNRYPDLLKAFGTDKNAAKNHWLTYGMKEKRNKFCYTDMTEAETKCYLKRFPDVSFTSLNDPTKDAKAAKKAKKEGKSFNPASDLISKNPIRAARMHYDTYGHFERRNFHCAPRITDIQADCYLRRYSDLSEAFNGDNRIKKARKHWIEFGFTEKRDMRCYSDQCNTETCKNKNLPKNMGI